MGYQRRTALANGQGSVLGFYIPGRWPENTHSLMAHHSSLTAHCSSLFDSKFLKIWTFHYVFPDREVIISASAQFFNKIIRKLFA